MPLLIKYGFPLDLDRSSRNVSDTINHRSVTSYPDHMDTYLRNKIENKAMLGPFVVGSPILNLHVSHFMTPKKLNSVKRRVITYLSWPIGESFNDVVTPDNFLDTEFVLPYPTVGNC